MIPTTAQLTRAIEIRTQIEKLNAELEDIFEECPSHLIPTIGKRIGDKVVRTKRTYTRKAKAPSTVPPEGKRKGPRAGTGLEPHVRAILLKSKKPLRAAEIFDKLVADGHKLGGARPRHTFGVRMYQFKTIKKLGEGLFTAE